MTFAHVIETQWEGYVERHRNRSSLLIHIVAVPVIWFATLQAIGGLFILLLGVPGAFAMLFWALATMAASLFAQELAHRMETAAPEKSTGATGLALRLAAEQYVNFPRFVLTGAWLRAWLRRDSL